MRIPLPGRLPEVRHEAQFRDIVHTFSFDGLGKSAADTLRRSIPPWAAAHWDAVCGAEDDRHIS